MPLFIGAGDIALSHFNLKVSTQFLRFAAVGLVSNFFLYLAYLLITGIGMGHKLAMTILYATGVCLTFLFNKNWTFSHRGRYRRTFIGYIFIYLLGYIVNFSALYVFVDRLEFPHQLVQGVMILVIAVLMFLLQKFLLFTSPTHNNVSGS
jgi:putative flippase GtrA